MGPMQKSPVVAEVLGTMVRLWEASNNRSITTQTPIFSVLAGHFSRTWLNSGM